MCSSCSDLFDHVVPLSLARSSRLHNHETLLHVAVGRGHVHLVALLLELGATVDAQRDDNGRTPLHYAAFEGYDDLVLLLMEAGCATLFIHERNSHAYVPAHAYIPSHMLAHTRTHAPTCTHMQCKSDRDRL